MRALWVPGAGAGGGGQLGITRGQRYLEPNGCPWHCMPNNKHDSWWPSSWSSCSIFVIFFLNTLDQRRKKNQCLNDFFNLGFFNRNAFLLNF